MDVIVTRDTISFYCEDCAHANVKSIELAGTKSICDGCKMPLRIPGAKLQRPSERMMRRSESGRSRRRSSESGESRRSSRRSRRATRIEEPVPEPRKGLITRLFRRKKRAS